MKIEACPSFGMLWLLDTYISLAVQVKAMRALQYFPTIEDPSTRKALFEVQIFLCKYLIYVFEISLMAFHGNFRSFSEY
jgi:hypothetical protein